MKELTRIAFEAGIMPILFPADENCAERVVNAVEQSEIPVFEVLQRGPIAEKVLKDAIARRKNAIIGAGTVCSLEQCRRMVDLGVDFIVSPGFDLEMVEWCQKNDVYIIPGTTNPSEVMMAARCGVELAKFFPFLELGGETTLEGIAGPFPEVKFVITGGLDERHLPHLANHRIAAVGGVWPFQSESDHTVISEEKIRERLDFSLAMAHHFRTGWK